MFLIEDLQDLLDLQELIFDDSGEREHDKASQLPRKIVNLIHTIIGSQ